MSQPFHQPYYGQIHPPFSPVVSLMTHATGGAKAKKIFGGLVAGGFLGGLLMVGGHKEHIPWLFYTGAVVGLLLFGVSLFQALKALQSRCPYCNTVLGNSSTLTLNRTDKNEKVECTSCFEWLISDQGTLRAFTPADIGDKKVFDCPVFQNAVWPQECIVCGQPAVRVLQARRTKLEAGKLIFGKISVASGSVNNIPYCAYHQDRVGVDIKDGILRVNFNDYAARRRYLAVNPYRKTIRKKGFGN